MMKHLRFQDLPVRPWKNGGGVTRELACWPDNAGFDDFIWRISIADISHSGPFSRFPGIDRIITLIDGNGMLLKFADGSAHALTNKLMPFSFKGEVDLEAVLLDMPSRDFNLMLRRGQAEGTIEVRRESGIIHQEQSTLVLFCAEGNWQVRKNEKDGSGKDCTSYMMMQGDSMLLKEEKENVNVTAFCDNSILLCVHINLLLTGSAEPTFGGVKM